MAVFSDDPDTFQSIDWRLLQNGSISLHYRPEVLAGNAEWLAARGYRLDELDCTRWDSLETMIKELADNLNLEECYSLNLDALSDSLFDIEIPEESGRVLIFHRYDYFAAKFPKQAWDLLDIIETKARTHLLFGRRLITLLQSDDPSIEFEPVGSRPVMWNWREWFNVSRGI